MQSKKQKLASNRNWNKGCLKGIKSHFGRMLRPESGLSKKEKENIEQARLIVHKILGQWI